MAYELPSIQGWMDDSAMRWLYERAQEMKSVVEIGSWKGRSTHALLSGCLGPVFAVDHFKGNPDELDGAHREALDHDIFIDFWLNVGHFRNLVVMRMGSVEAAQFFADRSVDMVFIDGCHIKEAVIADILAWKPKCRRLICGHDEGMGSVRAALSELGYNNHSIYGGIWIINV